MAKKSYSQSAPPTDETGLKPLPEQKPEPQPEPEKAVAVADAPKGRWHVTCPGGKYGPCDLDGGDEGEAIRRYIIENGITESHRYTFRVTKN